MESKLRKRGEVNLGREGGGEGGEVNLGREGGGVNLGREGE